MVLLTLGWEDLPKSVSVHGAPPEERLREPVPGVLLLCDGGWLLLDTGFNPALIRDPALRRRFHGDPAFRPVLPGPGEPLEEALADAGIRMEEIAGVAVSHLHNDHAGGLRHFAGRVPVHAQSAELAFGMADHPVPEEHAVFRVDFDDPAIDWRLAEGDTEIARGSPPCSPPDTPGTPELPGRPRRLGGRWRTGLRVRRRRPHREHRARAARRRVGVPPEATVEPIRRLKRVAAERGYQLVPGHDPIVWPALTATLAERFATTG